MNNDPIFQRIVTRVAALNDLDESSIKRESLIAEDLGLDSLDRVEMVMAMEEEFGIEVTDDAAEQILTINDAVDCVDRQTSGR